MNPSSNAATTILGKRGMLSALSAAASMTPGKGFTQLPEKDDPAPAYRMRYLGDPVLSTPCEPEAGG